MAGVFGDRRVIVMVSVTEETPYLSGLLATVTVMTLMTMICGRFLGGLIEKGLVALRTTAIRHPSQTSADSSSEKLLRPSARSGVGWPAHPQ
jgi:hypothetical protein